jgi:GUN4-like
MLKIDEQLYYLRSLNHSDLLGLSQSISERQEVIKTGKRKNTVLGVFNQNESLNLTERLEELNLLINDYNLLRSQILEYCQEYLDFFQHLTAYIKTIIKEKCQDLSAIENKRKSYENQSNNATIKANLKQQKQQILLNLLLLNKSWSLIQAKIKIFADKVKQIIADQKQYQTLINDVINTLREHEKIYHLQIEIDSLQKEIEQISDFALKFDRYLLNYFKPLKIQINEFLNIDNELILTIEEINKLLGDVLTTNLSNLELDDNYLNLLVINENQKLTLNDTEIDINVAIENLLCQVNDEIKQIANSLLTSEPEPITINIDTTEIVKQNTSIFDELEQLLINQKWREADLKTNELMLNLLSKLHWGQVKIEDLQKFTPEVLKTIDEMWLKYSQGKFALSVQKRIWLESGGMIDNYDSKYNWEIFCKFGDRLQWRKQKKWLQYDALNFDLNQVEGYLPRQIICHWLIAGLFSRL